MFELFLLFYLKLFVFRQSAGRLEVCFRRDFKTFTDVHQDSQSENDFIFFMLLLEAAEATEKGL